MKFIKGVNLGGWFVLERWMSQSLFEGLKTNDETGFVTQHPNPKEALEKHWETFIQSSDFKYIKSLGIHSVRIPIPWWLRGEEPYISPLKYIKHALDLASQYDLMVMLDLHTAPGSQNGFDNGGIEGVIEWHIDNKNIEKTVDVLSYISKELLNHPSVFSIEVLNEPHFLTDLSIIQKFYLDAYKAIRKNSDKQIVFHDAFRPMDHTWTEFFTKNNLENVGFDLHLYHCFEERLKNSSPKEHIDEILNVRLPMIEKLNKMVPVYVGEWSLGIHYPTLNKPADFNQETFEKELAQTQLLAYSKGTGYYFWNYKIEHHMEKHNWDFRSLVKKGILKP